MVAERVARRERFAVSGADGGESRFAPGPPGSAVGEPSDHQEVHATWHEASTK